MAKHIYVIDTCVLIHDPSALFRFNENDLYIPLAVIDDLDELKTKPASVGWSARETFRILDQFDLKQMLSKSGCKINEQGGRAFIINTDAPLAQGESPNISRKYSDNEIITAASQLKSKYPNKRVIIVTKDLGLRTRAQSFGCDAENYRSDLLEDSAYTGVRFETVDNEPDWTLLWKNDTVSASQFSALLAKSLETVNPNEFVVFQWGDSRCPTMFQKGVFRSLKDKGPKISFMEIMPRNLEQRCAMEALADETIPFVVLCGPAGTGKTLLALAVTMDKIQDEVYERLVIIKPLIPVGGKDIGALPGDKYDKISQWLGPMKDNLKQILGQKPHNGSKPLTDTFEELVDKEIIEVEAMAFIQGRSIPRAVILVDESQNLTPREARMVVERCAEGSKVIMLGDLSQVENPFLDARSCGLAHALNGGRNNEHCAAVALTKVERSQLSAVASQIFGQPEARR